MTHERDSMVLAVDGGGTRCRLALDWCDGRVTVEVGSANVSSDFNAATTEISSGLSKLSDESGVEMGELCGLPAHLALAGVTGSGLAGRVAEALPLSRAEVQDDRLAALYGALGDADGAIAHCGTGSFLALRKNGSIRLAGGWGPRLGDEASAQWIGRRALSSALDAVDGIAPESSLTRSLLSAFKSPAEMVAFAATASPAQVGRYAQTVTAHAENGDGVAREILQAGADEIFERLEKMGWSAKLPLCLTGGMGHIYGDYLPLEASAAITAPIGKPIDGAVALARRFGKELAA